MALKFTRLTRPAIRALQPGQSLTEHGIAADRLKDGNVRFSINIMVDGARIHRVIGRESEGVTREQAERAIESFRTKAREGRLDLPNGRKLHRTFAEAAGQYLERLAQSGGRNLKPKRMHLCKHLVPYFGQQRVDQLNSFALLTYRQQRLNEGAKDATVNREFASLSHMLRSGVKWGWLKAERLPEIVKERETREAVFVLSPTEEEALLQAAREDQDPRLWLFIMFGLGAAMRHREILRTRYQDINFSARRLFIPEAKAGEREQPITPALAKALERYQAMEEDTLGWVFPTMIPGQSSAGHRTNMARPFQRAVIRAGLDPSVVTPHTMRHTAITKLVRAGVDLPTIQQISGHKTLAMVLRYVHVHGEHIDVAISTLDTGGFDPVTPKLHTGIINEAAKHSRLANISVANTTACLLCFCNKTASSLQFEAISPLAGNQMYL